MKHIDTYGKFTDVHYQLFENIDLHETLNDILLPIIWVMIYSNDTIRG